MEEGEDDGQTHGNRDDLAVGMSIYYPAAAVKLLRGRMKSPIKQEKVVVMMVEEIVAMMMMMLREEKKKKRHTDEGNQEDQNGRG